MSALTTLPTRPDLVRLLRGKTIHLADLHAILGPWPEAINPDVEALRADVDARLCAMVPTRGKRLERLMAADAGLFAAQWWPYANPERLRIATWLSIWLFAWDDETDSAEFSNLIDRFDASQEFRAQTLNYIRYSLGAEELRYPEKSLSLLITNFKDVGDAVMKDCSEEQRSALLRTLETFIEMAEREQRVQLSDTLPSVDEYKERRMGTSGVAVCLAISEYAYEIELPQSVMQSQPMLDLWDETNRVISFVNDILSIRKEVMQGQVDSLVPLLLVEVGFQLQVAIDRAVDDLRKAVSAFNVAADELTTAHAADVELSAKIDKFITSSKYACTANLNWSLSSGRYLLSYERLDGGRDVVI